MCTRTLSFHSCNLTLSFLITTSPSFSTSTSVLLFRPSLLLFTSPPNTLLFSRASQGHCEITYFTDPLSSATLPTHQTADPPTLSLCLSLSVLLSRYLVFSPFHPRKQKLSQKNTDVYNADQSPHFGNYICDTDVKLFITMNASGLLLT